MKKLLVIIISVSALIMLTGCAALEGSMFVGTWISETEETLNNGFDTFIITDDNMFMLQTLDNKTIEGSWIPITPNVIRLSVDGDSTKYSAKLGENKITHNLLEQDSKFIRVSENAEFGKLPDTNTLFVGTWLLESSYKISNNQSTSAESILQSYGYKDGEVYILKISEDKTYSWNAYNHTDSFTGKWEKESLNTLIITDDGDSTVQKLVFSNGKITWDWESSGIGNIFIKGDGSEKIAVPE
jgi:hypothetical protein